MERKAGDVYEMVKSDTDIIIYSHSKSKFTIPVAAGKYMLKQVNVETGEEFVIDNRLRISVKFLLLLKRSAFIGCTGCSQCFI